MLRLALVATLTSLAVAQFERIQPDPEAGTGCGRGAPYSFFFRPGTVNKVVIDFEGGGGCWDLITCLLPTWATSVGGAPSSNGLVDDENPENPTRDWAYLYVPYCTGDVHLGARTAAGVDFFGRINARSALEYLFERMPEVEATLTTGCSAGALGAVGWGPWIAQKYPQARNVMYADSFIGVTTATHWQTLETNWDLLNAFVQAPGMTVPELQQYRDDICPYIVATTAANFGPNGEFPDMSIGQFTFNADSVQIAFSALAGAPSLLWTEAMREALPTAATEPNSGYMIAAGTGHCIIPGNALYTTQADGTRAIDWLTALIEGGDVTPQVVDCIDAGECTSPPSSFNSVSPAPLLDDWSCAAGFVDEYSARGFPPLNATTVASDSAHVLAMFGQFSTVHCLPRAFPSR